MRGSELVKLAAATAIVLAALLMVSALSPATTAGPCSVVAGPSLLDGVPEASGLAISRRQPGRLWTHNDSGNEPDLFALDASGRVQGRLRVPIRTRDWEDVSAAPCPSGDCLYIGDIGDNSMARRAVQVYRLPEPGGVTGTTSRPLLFNVTYPDGPHNAEAMFVAGGRLFIITRDREGVVYGTGELDETVRTLRMRRVAALGLTGVTDAEASHDGTSVAVRTEDEVVIYHTAMLISGKVAPQVRVPIGGLREPQGEAVALGENGTLYLASEGRPWSRAGRFVSLRCPTRPL